jgi:hemoglobin
MSRADFAHWAYNSAVQEEQIYAAVGPEGFHRLIAGFYRRVRTDDVLGPLYPKEDFAGAEERLRMFLIQRFGGPTTYSDQRGHPRLRMRHAPFRVDERARNRWVDLMEQALVEAAFPEETLPVFRKYFLNTATFMINHSASETQNRLGLRG